MLEEKQKYEDKGKNKNHKDCLLISINHPFAVKTIFFLILSTY